MKPLPACWIAFLGILTLAQVTASAEDDFRIKTMREVRSTDLIQVGNNWVKDARRIMVTLRVKDDSPSAALTLMAYFYDKDDKQVAEEKPNPIWTRTPRGFESVGVPGTLPKGKDIDLYFSVSDEIEAKKWKSVLVVFGNSTAVVARTLPAAALPKLDFPQKDHLVKEKPGL